MDGTIRSFFITSCLLLPSLVWGSIYRGDSLSQAPTVRVKIKKYLKDLAISGTDLQRFIHVTNKKKFYSGRTTVKFNCGGLHNKVSLGSKPLLLASLKSATGLVTLGREKFYGTLKIVTSGEKKSCDVINEISMDKYISTLLSKEMNASWPIEALKAQAVAARTYALNKMKTGQVSKESGFALYYDLESSEKHQVAGSFFDATRKTSRAATQTKGEVLLAPSGKLNPVFFHAKCGGKTLQPNQVWSNRVEGYRSVDCPNCRTHGKGPWRKKISVTRMKKFLSWAMKNGYTSTVKLRENIMLAPDKEDFIKLRFYVGEKVVIISKPVLRKYFGRFSLKSNNYIVVQNGEQFYLRGKGLGHGVGMCQLGALDLAKRGWDYKRILAYYFPEHQLAKVY